MLANVHSQADDLDFEFEEDLPASKPGTRVYASFRLIVLLG
jgi:hypothetical protein